MPILFCSLEHLLSCHFHFCSLELFFSLLRHLIINKNPKKPLVILGLFGYYPWHYGVLDILGLRIRDLGLSWRLCDFIWYFVWSSWGLPQDIGFFVCFVCRLLRLQSLFVIWNSPVYSRYSAQFLWRLNTFEVWFS